MKIYDCITYFDEPLLFDLRLNILNEFVDYFIVIEATYTHSGVEKKLNFNIKNFKKFENKIIYKVIKEQPKDILEIKNNDNENVVGYKKRFNALKRIELSYNKALDCLKETDPNDLFILSDSDEIPNLKKITLNKIKNEIIMFKQKMFYYKFDLFYDLIPWFGSRACKIKSLISPSWLRYTKPKKYPIWRIDTWFSKTKYNKVQIIDDGGWHFSNLKKPEEILKKFLNFGHHGDYEGSHDDYKESVINDALVKKMVDEKKVYYDHFADKKTTNKFLKEGYKLKNIEFSELPVFLVENFDTYREWFDKKNND